MDCALNPRRITFWLAAVAATLVLLHIVSMAIARFGYDTQMGLYRLVNLDGEANLPALFSTLLLLGCGAILALIGRHCREHGLRFSARWLLLAAIFVFLGVDEMVSIHEKIGALITRVVQTEGMFRFAWVLPYGLFVIVMAAAYLPFLIGLPRRWAVRFIIAGSIYVLGALGMELIGAYLFDTYGQGAMGYTVVLTIEETLEMTGLIVFIAALMSYARSHGITCMIGFRECPSVTDDQPSP